MRFRLSKPTRGVIALVAASSALLVVSAAMAATITSNPDGSTTVSAGSFSFKNFQLGGLPAEYCPDPNSPCQNSAAEPAIRADKFGNFFGSSENGLTSGTEAWKSIDGGHHYVHLPSPNAASIAATGGVPAFNVSPAGGDTDLATASAKNSFGIYNVYVSSLELANVAVSTSTDGGHVWTTNHTAAHFSGDDREWIAADGASKVCISYHDLASAEIHVDCSYDGGTSFTQAAVPGAIDAAHAYLSTDFMIGNMTIDQNSGNRSAVDNSSTSNDIVYQSFSGIGSATEAVCATQGTCGNHVVYMGVSLDGGRTFTDHTIYFNPDPAVSYGHQFVNVSVDQAGNVYAFYSDGHNLYYSYSTDHGTTWHGPFKVNRPPSATAIFPWSTAGAVGKVDVVWYGTSYYDGVNPPDRYPATAAWYVYFSQNLNAIGNPSAWSQAQASPVVHRGAVCEGGVGCTGNRDLYDDFGIAARPTTGLVSIIYSDDQFDQYNHTLSFPTACSAPNNNSGFCDHTSIATQTAGPGIY